MDPNTTLAIITACLGVVVYLNKRNKDEIIDVHSVKFNQVFSRLDKQEESIKNVRMETKSDIIRIEEQLEVVEKETSGKHLQVCSDIAELRGEFKALSTLAKVPSKAS